MVSLLAVSLAALAVAPVSMPVDYSVFTGARWILDWLAVSTGIVISLVMANVGQAGLVQRLMFLIALAWYGLETAKPTRSTTT